MDKIEQVVEELQDAAEDLRTALTTLRSALNNEAVPQEVRDRALAYWYPNILIHIDGDHNYLARGSHTIYDTLEELQELDKEPEED